MQKCGKGWRDGRGRVRRRFVVVICSVRDFLIRIYRLLRGKKKKMKRTLRFKKERYIIKNSIEESGENALIKTNAQNTLLCVQLR